jgi:hypothetical protein
MYSLDEQFIDNAWVPSQSKVRHLWDRNKVGNK